MVMSLWQKRVWPDVQRELDRIVRRLRPLDPERIVLFGSFARGDFHEGSDIDLMIVLNTNERFVDRLGRVLAAVDPDQFDVEPHVYTPAEYETLRRQHSVLVEAAEKEGKVLYERRT
jgi:predicted nucleotidyltransferase